MDVDRRGVVAEGKEHNLFRGDVEAVEKEREAAARERWNLLHTWIGLLKFER